MARVTQKCNVTITAEKAIQVIHHTKLKKKKKKLHVFIHSFNKYLLSAYHGFHHCARSFEIHQ